MPKVVTELEAGDATTILALSSGKIALHPTPETALARLTGLDADAIAFAEAALRLAMMGQQNDKVVETMLTRLEADRAAASGAGLVDEFEAAVKTAALALPDQPALVGFSADYLRLRTGAPTRTALSTLLSRHFTGETLERLETLAGMLDVGQLAQVFARVGSDNAALDRVLLEGFQTNMFACQEDMDINSAEGAAAVSLRLQTEFGWPKSFTDVYEEVLNTMPGVTTGRTMPDARHCSRCLSDRKPCSRR